MPTPVPNTPSGVRSAVREAITGRCREYPSVAAFAMLCEVMSSADCCVRNAVFTVDRML